MTTTGPTHRDLKSTLEEMRASVGGEARTGLAGKVQDAFLKIFEMLIALLMDFRAGKLAPVADAAAAGGVACPSPRPSPQRGEGEETRLARRPDSGWQGWRPAAWFRRHDWNPEEWIPACAGMTSTAGTFAGMMGEVVTFVGMTGEARDRAPGRPAGTGGGTDQAMDGGGGVAAAANAGCEARPSPSRSVSVRRARVSARAAVPRASANADTERFFKNAVSGGRIGAGLSFQDENDGRRREG